MRYKSCSTSLSGCQPDIRQLSDAWEIVLREVNSQERDVSLTHRKRDTKWENGLVSERVTARDLKDVIEEAREPARLSNLTLTASQNVPSREVIVKIGPGRRTNIFVESEAADYTWVSNISEELLKSFKETQKWFAPSGWWKVSRKLENLITSLPLLVSLVLFSVPCALILIVLFYYYFIVIQVPYELIVGLLHHDKWSGSDTLYLLSSLAVIAVTKYAISFVWANDQSVVITKSPVQLLSTNRVNILKAIAAIVAFIASIIAIVTFFK